MAATTWCSLLIILIDFCGSGEMARIKIEEDVSINELHPATILNIRMKLNNKNPIVCTNNYKMFAAKIGMSADHLDQISQNSDGHTKLVFQWWRSNEYEKKASIKNLKEILQDMERYDALEILYNDPKVKCQNKGRVQRLGLVEVRTLEDGNCFFSAVAIHLSKLMSDHESTPANVRSKLASIGLLETMDIHDIADHLRRLVVNEWKGGADEYSIFLPRNVNYFAEVSKFETPGFFDSPLGDHMPLAMSNVLGMALCIIPIDPNTSILDVYPTTRTDSPVQITLVYNACGPGHYNAAISKSYLDQVQLERTDNMEHAADRTPVEHEMGQRKDGESSVRRSMHGKLIMQEHGPDSMNRSDCVNQEHEGNNLNAVEQGNGDYSNSILEVLEVVLEEVITAL